MTDVAAGVTEDDSGDAVPMPAAFVAATCAVRAVSLLTLSVAACADAGTVRVSPVLSRTV